MYSQIETDAVYLSRKQNNMIYLRGRVKFPTGGKERVIFQSPRAVLVMAGSGEIPEPTVKSGWEKMEVLAFKMKILTVYLTLIKFSPQ